MTVDNDKEKKINSAEDNVHAFQSTSGWQAAPYAQPTTIHFDITRPRNDAVQGEGTRTDTVQLSQTEAQPSRQDEFFGGYERQQGESFGTLNATADSPELMETSDSSDIESWNPASMDNTSALDDGVQAHYTVLPNKRSEDVAPANTSQPFLHQQAYHESDGQTGVVAWHTQNVFSGNGNSHPQYDEVHRDQGGSVQLQPAQDPLQNGGDLPLAQDFMTHHENSRRNRSAFDVGSGLYVQADAGHTQLREASSERHNDNAGEDISRQNIGVEDLGQQLGGTQVSDSRGRNEAWDFHVHSPAAQQALASEYHGYEARLYDEDGRLDINADHYQTTPLPVSREGADNRPIVGLEHNSGDGHSGGGEGSNGMPPDDSFNDGKRRRSQIARNQFVIFANFIFTLLIVVGLSTGLVLCYAKYKYEGPGPLNELRTILIKPGSGVSEISAQLESEGFISSAKIFVGGVNYAGQAKELKAGEFEIPAHASMRQIIDILVNGRSIEHSFTVPEGLTVYQVFDRLKNNDMLTGDLPEQLPLEGSLMADTVNFVRGTPRSEIVRRLQSGQEKLIQDIWKQRAPDLPLKNINEMVTLASIVEKETGVASERPQVAAVFYNRLKINMRLQSDPTVIYGVFGGKGKPAGQPILRSQLDTPTPFNTYRINGLPPSPIAIPGKDALKAVANPPHTDALYFVADGTGGHVFSRSLDEHNANVRRWRELERGANNMTAPEVSPENDNQMPEVTPKNSGEEGTSDIGD